LREKTVIGFSSLPAPSGLALDERARRLYVLNHFDATISVVDLRSRQITTTTPLRYDPTPDPNQRLDRSMDPLEKAGLDFLPGRFHPARMW
jgi:DNA-binding beta-propeller fold protein YncE